MRSTRIIRKINGTILIVDILLVLHERGNCSKCGCSCTKGNDMKLEETASKQQLGELHGPALTLSARLKALMETQLVQHIRFS